MAQLTFTPAGLRPHILGEAPIRFIPLGLNTRFTQPSRYRDKLARSFLEELPDIWGTLGMDDDSPLENWGGTLYFSGKGNLQSVPGSSGQATLREIDDLRRGRHPAIEQSPYAQVLERYISFEAMELPQPREEFTWDQIPALRLTLFLKPDEGALVFYQHMDPDGPRKGDGPDGTSIEYLLPRPTTDHDCSTRDRLHYRIPILPSRRLEPGKASERHLRYSDRTSSSKFVVKVLTFRRGNSTSNDVMLRIAQQSDVESHKLWKWDAGSGCFVSIPPGGADLKARTLLFIHGTFSSTASAFADLSAGATTSWIAQVLAAGPYTQILGFDYPTIMMGPQANAAALHTFLGGDIQGQWDILTHSQGGLVGKSLSLEPGLPVNLGALVACANGVGYFTVGWGVAKALSLAKAVLGKAGHPIGAFISGLAQHSAEFFLNLPGPQAMTPGSPQLHAILDGTPITPTAAYLPVNGDFDASLIADHPWYQRWAENGLDLLIQQLLGKRNDWVVGTQEQLNVAPGNLDSAPPPAAIASTHTTYFGRPAVQDLISRRLTGRSIVVNP